MNHSLGSDIILANLVDSQGLVNIQYKAHPLIIHVNQFKKYTYFFARIRAAYLLSHSMHRVGVDPSRLQFRPNVALQSVYYT